MPLKMVDANVSTFEGVFEKFRSEAAAANNRVNFILFLADIDPSTSLSWCPDCVRSEPVIYKKLEESLDEVALLRAYAGDRQMWNNSQHPWRTDSRFNVRDVPTLILWEHDAVKARLEDYEAHIECKIDALFVLAGKCSFYTRLTAAPAPLRLGETIEKHVVLGN